MFEVEGVLVGIACESEPEPVAYTGMVLFAGVGPVSRVPPGPCEALGGHRRPGKHAGGMMATEVHLWERPCGLSRAVRPSRSDARLVT